MDSILVVLKNAPAHPDLSNGLRYAQQLRIAGHPVDLFLLQDAVLAGVAKAGELANVLAQGVGCYALEDDLRLRGYAAADLAAGVRGSSYDQLVDLMMDKNDRVLGAL